MDNRDGCRSASGYTRRRLPPPPPAACVPPCLPLLRRLLTCPAAAPANHRAETQQAPGKPFIKLDTAAGPLVLGFPTLPERDDAVELLKQLKPPGAGGGGSSKAGSGSQGGSAAGSPGGGAPGGAGGLLLPSAQQAAALFRADRDLESVYKSLVVSGILPEPDFWRARQAQLRTALAPGGVLAAGGGGGGSSGGGPAPARRQRLGLPNAMLADVKPSADGQTEKVHFQLTPQAIQQVRAAGLLHGAEGCAGRGEGAGRAVAQARAAGVRPVPRWGLQAQARAQPACWWQPPCRAPSGEC